MGGAPRYSLLRHVVDAESLLDKLFDIETF